MTSLSRCPSCGKKTEGNGPTASFCMCPEDRSQPRPRPKHKPAVTDQTRHLRRVIIHTLATIPGGCAQAVLFRSKLFIGVTTLRRHLAALEALGVVTSEFVGRSRMWRLKVE